MLPSRAHVLNKGWLKGVHHARLQQTPSLARSSHETLLGQRQSACYAIAEMRGVRQIYFLPTRRLPILLLARFALDAGEPFEVTLF